MQVMLQRPSLFENFYRRPSIKILPGVFVNKIPGAINLHFRKPSSLTVSLWARGKDT